MFFIAFYNIHCDKCWHLINYTYQPYLDNSKPTFMLILHCLPFQVKIWHSMKNIKLAGSRYQKFTGNIKMIMTRLDISIFKNSVQTNSNSPSYLSIGFNLNFKVNAERREVVKVAQYAMMRWQILYEFWTLQSKVQNVI